jgi:UDP-glucuronate 4-epimerase
MILITWTSGFIWFHLAKRLLKEWYEVIWVDNENDYYDRIYKVERREILETYSNFRFYNKNINNIWELEYIFKSNEIEKVVNLAWQPWVRYSLEDPFSYIQTNIVWFHNILFLCKKYEIVKLVYASSSSVYGNVKDTDHPISLYGATKKADELLAHSYSCVFWTPTIWLRFYTVYWPYWRPDMAMFKFTDRIAHDKPIDVYNWWNMKRDFTYVDDIVEWIVKALNYEVQYAVYDLWYWESVWIRDVISLIEEKLWKKAVLNFLQLQDWDVYETLSNSSKAREELWRIPKVDIREWIDRFVSWYKDLYL